jgi:DNA-binding transcriptional MocR family regulator
MDGWIKLHRKMLDWEWYNNNNTKIVFLHLLLTANHKEKKWKGITIKRGQKLTSIQHLAEDTNLSTQQVRTALDKLKSTNEITTKSTNKNTLITIEKYSDYQDKNEEDNKQGNERKNNRATNG